MRVISLFDGMSCGQLALEKAGIKVEKYLASEIDKYAIEITKRNFKKTEHIGNVFEIDYKKIGKQDLLIGGSPCTFWSISKKDRETTSEGFGFDLFKQYLRGLEETKADYFLYENNFSIHKNIQEEISRYLGVKPIMIDSALFTGQKRKRLYWTNIEGIKTPESKNIYVKDILENTEKGKIEGEFIWNGKKEKPEKEILTPWRIGQIGKGGQGQRIYSIYGKSVNLTANGGGQGAKTGLYLVEYKGKKIVRKLTPLECERLQGVIEGYTLGMSDTQRYKMLGNGWTIDVIAYILGHI